MAKTGSKKMPGTAEGAALARALHARDSDAPVLFDDWAIHLLAVEDREKVLQGEPTDTMAAMGDFDTSPIFAVNVGCLRYAEDEIDKCLGSGSAQYLILGAGLDTFALRRNDLLGKVAVYEVDHPDVQALKIERIRAAGRVPATMPVFVAVDFETTGLDDALGEVGFDKTAISVATWLNTTHYLSVEAIDTTLSDLATVLAPGSRLILNYAPDVALSEDQIEFVTRLLSITDAAGEPLVSRFTPQAFEQLLQSRGFAVIEHADEAELTRRYFKGRDDGLYPGLPLRIIIAERIRDA
ncbi:MAG: SAM-dependent methyltransferase [Halieaceae bacterium]|nr:SAM-dependent methyltransferase [Halieaceae bacterium]